MYEINMIITATLWIAVVFIYRFSPSASVFNPITFYLFFHGLVFVVRPIFKYLYDFQSMYNLLPVLPSEETRNLALIALETSASYRSALDVTAQATCG